MYGIRLETTEGLLFLLPTIVIDTDNPSNGFKEVSLVWFYMQLTIKW